MRWSLRLLWEQKDPSLSLLSEPKLAGCVFIHLSVWQSEISCLLSLSVLTFLPNIPSLNDNVPNQNRGDPVWGFLPLEEMSASPFLLPSCAVLPHSPAVGLFLAKSPQGSNK